MSFKEISLKSDVVHCDKKQVRIVYHLFEQDHQFGIECYKWHYEKDKPHNYIKIENITDDENVAKDLLHILCDNKVFPLHIADVISDYFSN